MKNLQQQLDLIYTGCITLIILAHFSPAPRFTSIFIGVLCFIWVFIDWGFKKKWDALKGNKLAFLFIGLSLLNLLGMLYSEDQKAALFVAERRTSLFIFPIILSTIFLKQISVQRILFTVVVGCFLTSFIGFLYSLSQYISGNGGSDLFYNDNLLLLFKMQAVYFAFFTNVSVFIVIHLISKGFFNKTFKYFAFFLIAWFILINFLMASRLSIIILYLTGISFLAIYLIRSKKYKTLLISLFGVIVLLLTIVIIFPKTMNRFKAITNIEYDFENTNRINHFNDAPKKENWNGLNIRLAIWACATETYKESAFIGYGSGDAYAALRKKYEEKKFHFALQEDYNTHNQYLDFGLSFGILGVLVLIASILYPILVAFKQGNYLYLAFLILLATSMLTENILNRNMGIIFYGLLNSLMAFHLIPSTSNQEQEIV